MNDSIDTVFYKLLRVALGLSQDFPYTPTEQEWLLLFKMAKQQTVLGVVFDAISLLPEKSRPPRLLIMRLSYIAEAIRGTNCQMNQEASRYTRLFANHNFHSVILKGPANARLYPNPLSRQAGDIDIWVPGSYDNLYRLLHEMKFISEYKGANKKNRHISFCNENGINIEVHYRPAETPFRNKEFQKVLLAEFGNSMLTPEGFYTPSIRFALIMQLQHLYRHCIKVGVGLRHYMDYFMLVTHSTETDRKFAWETINRVGLRHACAGVMWVLEKVFGLPREQMLCPPEKKCGMHLYKSAIEGGNFGKNASRNREAPYSLKSMLKKRLYALSWLSIDPLYVLLSEFQSWKKAIAFISEHFKRRKRSNS